MILTATCSGTSGQADVAEITETTEPAREVSRPFSVDTVTETFVDESRPTDDPAGVRRAPTRTLVTDIYVPEGQGPLPLVVFAHGLDGHPSRFTELATTWAEAGYVVAVPAFPLTNDQIEGNTDWRDHVNQPADVSFVIDQVVRLSEERHPLLGGRVDAERIGVGGFSLGGATASSVAFTDCCGDDRLDAAIIMDAVPLPIEDEQPVMEGIPLLLVHLTDDLLAPYEAASNAYADAGPPKFLVSLLGHGHGEPYEDTHSPYDELVATTTVAFWDMYLDGDAHAIDVLVDAAESSELSTIMFED
jgi:predicted dienelactone hydrolase